MARRSRSRSARGAPEPTRRALETALEAEGSELSEAPPVRTPEGGSADPICPLCLRPIPPDARQSVHHLTPKLRGGKHGPRVLLHQICHNEIHATLSETELARSYATPEQLRAHPRLAKFIAWVALKSPYFHSRTAGGRRLRKRRP